MTRFGPTARGVRVDDALLDSLARREEPPVGSDGAVRLLADLAVVADASSPGLGLQPAWGGRLGAAATPPRGTRPSLAWAAAAAAAAVVAVALGTVAPQSSPRPGTTVQVSPVSLSRASTLIAEAGSILGPAGSLVTPGDRARARALLTQARTELDRARQNQEGQPVERDEVEQSLLSAETALTESGRGLDGRDEETSTPSPTPTATDEDEPKSETTDEKSVGEGSGSDNTKDGTPSPPSAEEAPRAEAPPGDDG
ncbi:hypothetical protein [Terrabacter sp. 2RAF25]|uniref:hypothetical protein n=1 Tax=Terrabacter sp. 2RAF25 TaxID=3232998 RepID=UPI003F943E3A